MLYLQHLRNVSFVVGELAQYLGGDFVGDRLIYFASIICMYLALVLVWKVFER